MLKIFVVITAFTTIDPSLGSNLMSLKENFFENLKADPHLLGDKSLSFESRRFIDEQINNFKKLNIAKTSSRSKRDNKEKYVEFVETTNNFSLSLQDIRDFEKVSNGSDELLAVLQEDKLTLYNLTREVTKLTEFIAPKSVKVKVLNLNGLMIVALIDQKAEENHVIISVLKNSELVVIQSIKVSFVEDLEVWTSKGNGFLSIATSSTVLVYEWKSLYFDKIQELNISRAIKITHFEIGEIDFIALAKFNTSENAKTYSELFKYNEEIRLFQPFQRIMTSACRDIKYFTLNINGIEESFLIVANYYEQATNSLRKRTRSIAYKFVDDYFIPFQSFDLEGVYQWEPLQNNLLLALTERGIKSFKFDGWKFQKINNGFLNFSSVHKIISYRNNSVLFLQKSNETKVQGISLTVIQKKSIEQIHKELYQWCQNSQKLFNVTNEVEILRQRGDIVEEEILPPSESLKIESGPQVQLESIKLSLKQLEDIAKSSLKTENHHNFNQTITSRELICSDCFIDDLSSETINSLNINDLLSGVLKLDQGFKIENDLTISDIELSETSSVHNINNHSAETLMKNLSGIKKLIVKGTASLEDLEAESINGQKIDSKHVFLLSQDQKFEEFNFEEIEIEDLEVRSLNSLDLNANHNLEEKPILNHIETLRAKKITIGGLMNGVDLPTLNKYSLRKSGNQVLTKTYYFDSLKLENLEAEGFITETLIPEDLIITKNRSYFVEKDIKFSKELKIENLQVLNHLNTIPVINQHLDILDRSLKEEQHITGAKTFDYMTLTNLINSRGKILSKNLDSMNPVLTINETVEVDEDIVITGHVNLEDILRTNNVVTADGLYSLQQVIKHGLRLDEKEIPMKIKFKQHLEAEDIFVETINNIDPQTWVSNGDETQVITGLKRFKDLKIIGESHIFKINDINMQELESNTLRINGDQIITGKLTIKHLASDKGIISSNVTFGPNPWKEVLTTDTEQVVSGLTVFNKSLKASETIANSLKVNGLINGENYEEKLKDVLKLENASLNQIKGHKNFSSLIVENLTILEGFNLNESNSLTELIYQNLTIPNAVNISTIKFDKSLNDWSKTELEEGSSELTVEGNKKFKKVTVFGSVSIDSEEINGVNLQSLSEHSIKVDEEIELESCEFDEIEVGAIQLEGQVENLDLDNVIDLSSDEQIILDLKTFIGPVKVAGQLKLEGRLNQFQAEELCDFNKDDNHLILTGNAVFSKGPIIGELNGNNFSDMFRKAWIRDRATEIENYATFNKITFKRDISVKGYVDETNLENMANNYLSKTKNQTIQSTLIFSSIVFQEEVTTPVLEIGGTVNDLNMADFIQNVLLYDEDQIFETIVFLENCTVKDLHGEYLVNGLDLQNDVLKHNSTTNLVTGYKAFQNLTVKNLKIDKDVMIQNVNVKDFINNSVLKTGNFKIKGDKTIIKASFENGIGLEGTFNDEKFDEDTIMLRSLDQDITGKKVFQPKTTFKSIKLEGPLNNVNIRRLFNNQANKNKDITFETPINFHNKLMTKNINIDIYQGMDVKSLISNISSFDSTNTFLENFETMLDMTQKVQKSLVTGAFYLRFYKNVFVLEKTQKVLSIESLENEERIISFAYRNGSNMATVHELDENSYIFNGFSVNLGFYPTYMKEIIFKFKSCLYQEHPVVDPIQNEGFPYHGSVILYKFKNSQLVPQILFQFPTNATKFISSIQISQIDYHCLLMVSQIGDLNIICSSGEKPVLLQKIPANNIRSVAPFHIKNLPYIVILREKQQDLSSIEIWKWGSNQFELNQVIYEDELESIATVVHQDKVYLASASGLLEKTNQVGRISIRRLTSSQAGFELIQEIDIEGPTFVKFSILPTRELVLYILTNNPAKPFIVYAFNGIAGFVEKLIGSSIGKTTDLSQFTIGNKYFIAAQHSDEISVIEAVFSSEKWV